MNEENKTENLESTAKKKRNVTPFLIILIIFALGCIAAGLFIVPLLNNQNPEQQDEEREIAITSPTVITAYEAFNSIYISPAELYSESTYDISSISNYDLIASGLKLLDKSYVTFCPTEPLTTDVSLTQFNRFLQYYIAGKTITMDNVRALTEPYANDFADYEVFGYGIKVVDDDNIRIAGPCGVVSFEDFEKIKVTKANENDKYVYIYAKIAFASYTVAENESFMNLDAVKVNYYNTYDKTGAIMETLTSDLNVDENDNAPADSEPNWSLYNTYKFTIEKDNNNNYYFKKLELVED